MIERSLIEAAARLRRHGEPYLVATVVSARGAAIRRPGARMLLTRFRWIAGAITGGCLEGDLSSTAWIRTLDGAPLVVTYDARQRIEDDDVRSAFGLTGDAVVDVLIERAGLPGRLDALEVAARCVRAQTRGVIATVIRAPAPVRVGARLALLAGAQVERDAELGPPGLAAPVVDAIAADLRAALELGATAHRSYSHAGGEVVVLLEPVLPPPRLFVFGTGHDAVPLAQLARQLGWEVAVCVAEARVATRERFGMADELLSGSPAELAARIDEAERAVVVVMSHEDERDRAHLGAALATRARYIGVLGPRARTARLLEELGRAADGRLYAPAGGELAGDTPHEQALAMVAEIQAVLRVRAPAREPAASATDRAAPHRTSAIITAATP